MRGFASDVAPGDVAFADADDLYPGTQRIAGVMVAHLRLPEARVIVSFREGMTHAANVELEAGPEYFVELNARFKQHRRDIGAALAHEVTHVWLHRLGLAFEGTRANEILTDTAAAYLGAGWLLLDAFRQDALTSQKLGYLTPEEFGYVLAKRAQVWRRGPGGEVHQPAGIRGLRTGPPRRGPGRGDAPAGSGPLGGAAPLCAGPAARRGARRHGGVRLRAGRRPGTAGVLPLPHLPGAAAGSGTRPGPRPVPAVRRGVVLRHLNPAPLRRPDPLVGSAGRRALPGALRWRRFGGMAPSIATNTRVGLDELLEFVRPRHRAILLTRRADGTPQASPLTCGVDSAGRIVVATYPERAKTHNARREAEVSVLVLSDEWNGPWVQVDGAAEVLDVPEAVEPLVEYFRAVSGEHPDWDEYRSAMVKQGKSLIRVTPQRWGPIATGGFPRPPRLLTGDHAGSASGPDAEPLRAPDHSIQLIAKNTSPEIFSRPPPTKASVPFDSPAASATRSASVTPIVASAGPSRAAEVVVQLPPPTAT